MSPVAQASLGDTVLDGPVKPISLPSKAPQAPCLVTDLILYQVQQNPQVIAVEEENNRGYTYGELWQLVEQIAAKADFAPGDIIPVCMNPTVVFVASLLAIMLRGAAYVVLDPAGSAERNQRIADDCGAPYVMVNDRYVGSFTRAHAIEALLAEPTSTTSQQTSGTTPSNLAYLVYTSGSTGNPKGVMVSHRAASLGISQFDLRGHRRWLLFYNPVFSAAQRTVLATLAKGACLCLARRDRLAAALPAVLKNLKVDALGITPSALSLLSPTEIPTSLQQVTTVGEPLSSGLVEAWAGRVHLRVSYGLSECAQLNFSRRLQPGDNARSPGRPIDTTKAMIWEPGTTQQLPSGTPGELCLSGPQVADGYYLRPEETAAAFLRDPESLSNIVFRTGDLAVHHSDGSFEILGRIDQQIKIHGQRVEPGEVASVLRTGDGAVEVVCVGAYIHDKLSLVAAVIPGPQMGWVDLVRSLRDQARRELPSYMMPSYWLQCQEFPVNGNGKIDLRAIRKAAEFTPMEELLGRDATSLNGSEHVFTEIAREIVDVWAKHLHVHAASILPTDSFVALGGSSIEAIQVIRDLRTRGVHVQLADMMQSQTAEDVADAAKVSGDTSSSGAPKAPEPFALLTDTTLKDRLMADRGAVDAFPVTALQEGILASTLQGNPEYLYQRVFDVRHLDLVRLQLAFRVAFWHSDLLRSTFVAAIPGFAQVVRTDFQLRWLEGTMSLSRYLARDKKEGVTLGQPFMRAAVLNGGLLVVSVHHALFDFWSHGFLFDDVAGLYHGQAPEARVPWGSFVALLQQQRHEQESQVFWRQYLADVDPTILNHSPVVETSVVTRTLPVDLRAAAAGLQAPKSAILYAAWALILSSYTASKTVTMATVMSGREQPLAGIDRLDGPTLAVAPLAVRVNPEQSLVQLVQAVNADIWQTTKYAHAGIRGALSAAGHQGDGEFFDTLVNILVRGPGRQALTEEVFQQFGPNPVWKTEFTTLNIEEGAAGIEVTLVGALEVRQLEFIIEQYCRAVQTIIEAPHRAVKSIDLLGEEELDLLLGWNEDTLPAPRTLQGQFEHIASEYPSRVAVNWENEKLLTYAELNELANRMANFLSERGVSSGDLVPILLEKSPVLITTILAVLKLGAAYVPLSPENPVERNAFIVRDIGARVILTQTEHASYFASKPEKAKEEEAIPQVLVDTARLCAYSTEQPEDETSGSTGQPKGVMIHHRGCAAAMQSIIAFEKRDQRPFKQLQFSNYIFDASVYDIFATLHSGGTVCLASPERLLGDLAGVIRDMGVNHLFLTPTVARLLDPQAVPTLESITVGGEPLTPDVVATWASKVTLINAYGPTETSVMVTMKNFTETDRTGNIGTVFPTTGLVILEQDGVRPVPYGAVGELCFWGPQLSRGYLNRPETTAAAFVHSDIRGGQRLYRSGDLGRYIPGGDIECLGRKDDQVKINGHRIELGEIEQAIMRTDAVRECVLTVWKRNTTAHLVAVVAFGSGVEAADDEGINHRILSLDVVSDEMQRLKTKLKGLAHYMFPKFLLPLPAFPRLPSGKADRKQLKARVQALSQVELTPFAFDAIGADQLLAVIPVVTREQKVLHEAWVTVLQLPHGEFGLEASFLGLGGDSIAAINLVSCLRQEGYSLAVRDVLRFPVLESMASQLVRNGDDQEGQQPAADVVFSAPPEVTAAVEDAIEAYEAIYPCPPEQSEFLAQGARPESFWSLMTVRSLGRDSDPFQWLAMAKRLTETNDILRTTFLEYQDQWYGVVLPDATPIVEFYDASGAEERSHILDAIWQQRFEFGKPFIRYGMLRMADGEVQVVIKLDHGLYDGTLLRVFDAHCQRYQFDEPVDPFTSFQDFALHIWQRNRTQPTLAFWQQPDKRPIRFQLAPGRPQDSEKQVRVTSVAFHMIEHAQLDQYSRAHGVTVSILFQTIFQLWLARRSGQQTVAFDYLTTGRNIDLPDPQGINGTCANFVPMRSDVDPRLSLTDFLRRTQDAFWQYTENSTVAIADIYRAAGLSRAADQNEALFLFQPFEPAAPTAGPDAYQRWLVMARSEVRMAEPYAVVFEVSRTAQPDRYRVKFAYDGSFWTAEETARELAAVERIVSRAVEDPAVTVGELLRGLDARQTCRKMANRN
ncbi:nonribosomal peptide synthase SidE [Aspergillus fijiensis CBS 313.89]|uniref:Acetyl-CoA synthetase-like protein n=1 Tax=Aspergillus fijiensis CBS 313.89 TaxID=1448319 RepID=A0A8G1VYQ9_9EURO|nr:acetyl-CoA synthetase-like protein [Aspergillus fijiensis CBS 313.89]RAK76561.1 acetyl-CoA synthetase-like protein [Aspergillus fijiensis CBS 313.89]